MHGIGLANSQKRNGRWFVLLSLLIVMTTCWGVTPGGLNSAWGQEEAEAPAGDDADDVGEPEAAIEQVADEPGAEETSPPTKNALIWMAEASGIFGLVLLILSIVMLTLSAGCQIAPNVKLVESSGVSGTDPKTIASMLLTG